jgi:hypothetical protein
MKGIRKPDSLPDDDLRHSSKQIFRVLLGGLAKKVFRLAKFNQFSRSHHGNPRRDLRDHRQTVRNEDICEAEFALEILKEQQDLRAYGYVQRRDWLVRNHQLRL